MLRVLCADACARFYVNMIVCVNVPRSLAATPIDPPHDVAWYIFWLNGNSFDEYGINMEQPRKKPRAIGNIRMMDTHTRK